MLATKKIWPLLLVFSLIIQRVITSIEINSILLILLAGFFFIVSKGKMIKNDLELISVLFLIVFVGVFSALFNKPTIYNFIRDLLYFTKPIILILLGYFIAKRINNWGIIFKALIYLGVGYAVYHISHTLIFTDFKNATVASIRRINGLSNIIEMFAIALIILGKKIPFFNVIQNKRTKNFFLILLSVSFLFYFSRTMLVGLIFLILGVLNYLKLNMKGLKYSGVFLLLVIALYTYLFSVDLDRNGGALESFFYKIKIAPAEIFMPDKNFDIKNHANLWDHWRAYEASRAFEGMNGSPISYISGKGFGALVDLKFEAPLGSEGALRYIPILHNGYVFVLFKTGIIGLFLYLIFLFYLYFQAYQKTRSAEVRTFGNLLSASALYIIFSSLIITGLYNLGEETALLLGIFIYLKSSSKLKEEHS
jgi:hypothetical protein